MNREIMKKITDFCSIKHPNIGKKLILPILN